MCDPDTKTWTTDGTTVTMDMNGETCGSTTTITTSALVMLQVRYDPDTYTTPTVMDFYGMMSDDCIMKMSYSSDTVQVT